MSDVLTVGSLFSGIGGIDLGLERAGMKTRWFSEIDPYASKVLAKHWPDVPNHGDITKIDFTAVEPVDVLAGGFPCINISSNGKKDGIDGEHSSLWADFARAVRVLRPRYVFVENVRDLLVRGVDRVLGDLAALGYDAEWDCIPAASVGAPQFRDRFFLVAYGYDRGCGGRAECHIFPTARLSAQQRYHVDGLDLAERGPWVRLPGVRRVDSGFPNRAHRIRGIGNAVVPQIPELIGGWIIEHARASRTEDV